MQQIQINQLKPHPRNNEFFDDIVGDKWQDFLQSIKTSGVIEPIVITQDGVIVSGHQRVRACKELGIDTVTCDVKIYQDDDAIIKDLLETNIRQRGSVGGSDKKIGLRIRELERLYGIKQGGSGFYGNRYSSDDLESRKNFVTLKTQEELANDMNMDVRTYQNYKILADMIPELDEMVKSQKVSKTTALAIMNKLSEEEQKELISTLPSDKKYTQKQMDEEIQKYKNRISELVQQKTKTEIVTQEVDRPETIKELERLQQQLAENIEKNQKLSQMIVEKEKMISQAIGISTNYQLTSHCSEITLKMLDFVKEMSQYDYMAESFNEIPNATRIEYEKCIKSVKKWADRILNTIYQTKDIIDN